MKNITIILMMILFISITGCSSGPEPDNLIASFEGGRLTIEDLDAHYQQMKKSRQFKNQAGQLTPEFVFEHALNMEMIITKGLEEKLHQDPRIRARIHEFMSNLFLDIMQEHLVPKIDKAEFTDQELKEFYESHKENYRVGPLFTINMIKTADKTAADQALLQIRAGLSDFKTAAQTYSIDKSSKKRGGSIGTRALKKFTQDWQPIIAGLPVGPVSGPHQIKGHFYLFELKKKTQAIQYSFEEKKPYIRNDLLYVKYKQAWDETYSRLKKKYKVTVNEDKLSGFIQKRSKS